MKSHISDIDELQMSGRRALERRIRALLLLLLGFAASRPDQAAALGVRIPNQDAAAIARGNAFVATADNPSAIYYNPAGITQLDGQNAQIGSLFYLGIYGEYESPAGQTVHNQPEVIAAPSLQYTLSLKDVPLSFGFGVYEPFGFSVKWPNEAPFRQEGLTANLMYITLNPVVAWRVLPNLSIAAGPTFNYSKFKVTQGVFPVPYILPGDEAKFSGTDWSYGFNLGALWQPDPKWGFGVSYRSSSHMNYSGDFGVVPSPPLPPIFLKTSATLDFPQVVIGGVSWKPTTNWNVEVDLDWADWSTLHNFVIQGVSARNLDWHSSFMPEIGVTRYLAKGYYLSAGYFFSQASTSTDFYTPLLPDTDLHIASIGGGYKGKTWSWAVAFQAIFGGWRDVTVNSIVNPTVNGQYRLFTPTLSFTVGYHF